MAIDTGNAATITFATSSFTASFTDLDPGELTKEDLDTSHLGTTGQKTYKATDLVEPGELTATFFFDSSDSLPGLGTSETVTVTFPNNGTTAATIAGTGYIKRIKYPPLRNGELQQAELTVKWDGLTDAAFTAES